MIDQAITTVLSRAGSRIVGINEHTRDVVIDELQKGFDQGLSIYEIMQNLQASTAFTAVRSETVARTETMFAYNTAALDSYRGYGVEEVEALDGDDDEVCAARNGQVYPIAQALDIEDHPNGTLDWAPVFTRDTLETATPQEVLQEPDGVFSIEQDYDFHTEEGGLVNRTTGEALSVNPGQGSVEAINLAPEFRILADVPVRERANLALTHSHPGASSFSTADVVLGSEAQIGEMRAIGREYIHSIVPRTAWPTKSQIEGAARRAYDELLSAARVADAKWQAEILEPLRNDVIAGGGNFQDRTVPAVQKYQAAVEAHSLERARDIQDIQHNIWEMLADDLGLIYRRTSR